MIGNKIRIGKDIVIMWNILTNGEPISLEGRNLKLVLSTPLRQKINLNFEVAGNEIKALYKGVEHKVLGSYTLTLWENYGTDGQSALDYCNAFTLVPLSCLENESDAKLAQAVLQLSTQQTIGSFSETIKETNEVNI